MTFRSSTRKERIADAKELIARAGEAWREAIDDDDEAVRSLANVVADLVRWLEPEADDQ